MDPVRLLEEGEIDRIGHGLVPGIIRMQVIFRREAGQEPAGMIRVAQNSIEVDYAIKGARLFLIHWLTVRWVASLASE